MGRLPKGGFKGRVGADVDLPRPPGACDVVDPEGGVERWVLIGHSMHQHYRVSVEAVCGGREAVGVHRAACGYSYQKGFELIPEGDLRLPRCPRCLAAMANSATGAGVRG